MGAGGVEPRPYAGGWKCGAGGYGLPHQRARWFAMTGYRKVRCMDGG